MLRRRRLEIARGLRLLGKVLGASMAEIPANPRELYARVRVSTASNNPQVCAAWPKIQPLVRAAMERWGLSSAPGRYGHALAPQWSRLFKYRIPKHLRLGLMRFCRFASARGIKPHSIDDSIFDEFLSELTAEGLIDDPRRLHREACRSWNEAASQLRRWPKIRVTVPDYRNRYQTPLDAFPASFTNELDSYLARLSDDYPMSEIYCAPLRPSSIRATKNAIRSHASAMVQYGVRPEDIRSLSDLVSLEAVQRTVRFQFNRQGNQITKQAATIAVVIASLARQWVKVEPHHQKELDQIRRRLTPRYRYIIPAKTNKLLRQFDDPNVVKKLLTLPQQVFKLARSTSKAPLAAARLVSTALAIELLLVAPIRLSELAALDIDESFILRRRRYRTLLVLRRGRSQNITLEFPLGGATQLLLAAYLRKYRPLLAEPGCRLLFPAKETGPQLGQAMRNRIVRATEMYAGISTTPGLFRHFAAKHYLDKTPGDFEVVRAILGHQHAKTTELTYAQMNKSAAVRLVDNYLCYE